MNYFVIVETSDGFTIGSVGNGQTPESVAKELGGVLIDPGPYDSFQQAQDVVLTLENPYEANWDAG